MIWIMDKGSFISWWTTQNGLSVSDGNIVIGLKDVKRSFDLAKAADSLILGPATMGGRTHQKAKPAKHPNRAIKTGVVDPASEYKHLKYGKVYKLTFHGREYDFSAGLHIAAPDRKFYLYREAAIGTENRINTLESGKPVIYLGMETSGHGLFFKIVYGDQVGFIKHNSTVRFKRYTNKQMGKDDDDEQQQP